MTFSNFDTAEVTQFGFILHSNIYSQCVVLSLKVTGYQRKLPALLFLKEIENNVGIFFIYV